MNNITSFLIGAPPTQSSDRNVLTEAEAWRKAFEKENYLSKMKSVKPETFNQDSSTHDPSAATASANQQEVNHAPFEGKQSPTQEQAFSQSSNKSLLGKSTSEIRQGEIPFTEMQFLLNKHQSAPLFSTSQKYTMGTKGDLSAIGFFESFFKQKWPLKNVHILDSDDGVRVWIRDSNLPAGSLEIQKLVEQVQQAFKVDGKTLIELVINGKTVFE